MNLGEGGLLIIDDVEVMVWVIMLLGFYMLFEWYCVVLLFEVFVDLKYMMFNILGWMDNLRVVILWL